MKSLYVALFLSLLAAPFAQAEDRPNIVVIMTDDQGWADLGKYGAKDFETPNLDRMADEGVRFTNWYVPQAVCGASRAGLLTGCYPNRIGMLGAPGPGSKRGIAESEVLISEMVRKVGYATGIFGKWHLGDAEKFLPVQNGFDEYFGLPYSNDMWPYHPGVRHLPMEKRLKAWPHLPLIEGNKIINAEMNGEDQAKITTQYTEHAVDFIKRNKEKPFFLYVPHSMPHVPLYVSDKFKGKSKQGLYGDVIMEIDWSVGQILEALKKEGLDEKTVVLFTSDNGPWLSYGNHAGSAGPLREGKGTAWEGGQRVPCIARWPKTIPAGKVCNVPAMHIDLFPTIAKLVGGELPSHGVDGKDIGELFSNPESAVSPHEAYYLFWGEELHAVRSGDWSLHFPHSYRSLKGKAGKDGIPSAYEQKETDFALFDLATDLSQTIDVKAAHGDVYEKLKALGMAKRDEIAKNKRAPGAL
jgi:arylsulfatase A